MSRLRYETSSPWSWSRISAACLANSGSFLYLLFSKAVFHASDPISISTTFSPLSQCCRLLPLAMMRPVFHSPTGLSVFVLGAATS